jgi:hypothetical protein
MMLAIPAMLSIPSMAIVARSLVELSTPPMQEVDPARQAITAWISESIRPVRRF